MIKNFTHDDRLSHKIPPVDEIVEKSRTAAQRLHQLVAKKSLNVY